LFFGAYWSNFSLVPNWDIKFSITLEILEESSPWDETSKSSERTLRNAERPARPKLHDRRCRRWMNSCKRPNMRWRSSSNHYDYAWVVMVILKLVSCLYILVLATR
jgi:hypothetical protein